MSQPQQFEVLILGSGEAGKLLAWHMAQSGRRTAVVERRWVGGSCPNIACLPSKNEIWSARVAHLARQAGAYGATLSGSGPTVVAVVASDGVGAVGDAMVRAWEARGIGAQTFHAARPAGGFETD